MEIQNKSLLIGITALAGIALIGGGAYLWKSKNKKNNDK